MRVELVDAALRLMADRGFDGVTVDEIAAACGLSTRTVFRYFPTKDDLVVAPLFGHLGLLQRSMQDALAEGEQPLQAVVRAGRELAARIDADGDRTRFLLRLMFSCRSLRARAFDLERAWEATVALELQNSGIEPTESEVIAAVGCSVLAGPARTWAEHDRPESLATLVERAAQIGLGVVLAG